MGAEREGQATDSSTQRANTHPCPAEIDLGDPTSEPAKQLMATGSVNDFPAAVPFSAENTTGIVAGDGLTSARTTSLSEGKMYRETMTREGEDGVDKETQQASSTTGEKKAKKASFRCLFGC